MKKFIILVILSTIILSGCTTKTFDNQKIDEENQISENKEETKEVYLYYHNLKEDKAQYDRISLNEEFILPIKRNIPISKTPIRDTFDLLFKAELTQDEIKKGFVAGIFETYNFEIKSLVLNDGVLRIDFTNNINLESLSSAESSVLFNSIKKTAQQFPEIKKIEFKDIIIIDIN